MIRTAPRRETSAPVLPRGSVAPIRAPWFRAGLVSGAAAWLLTAGVRAAPVVYREAPMLAERVATGVLPPVARRLPDHPVVVEPVERVGTYGGSWRRLIIGQGDMGLDSRLGYEPIVRWDRTGRRIVPGFAESWEIRDEAKTYVFRLVPGLRWSDGQPITSADVRFWYDDVVCDKELTPVFPSWLKSGDRPAVLEAPDPETVIFRFAAPYGVFLETLAFRGQILAPRHYLQQFHPRYADKAVLEARARQFGLDLWHQLFARMSNANDNPDLPTWRPFKLRDQPPAARVVAERNPYYWKVDPAGQQLPYLDQIVYTELQNGEILTLKAMAGEADFQDRRVDPSNYPLFMENRERGHYRVLRDVSPGAIVLYVNQWSKDPVLRPILQDRRFRVALSHAINRKELIFLLFSNLAVPARGVASPYDPYYLPEFDAKYMEYDPARAQALLDEVGLRRRGDGLRRFPDGSPFRQVLNVYPSEAGTSSDLWQLVADYFREVGLDFVVKIDAGALSVLQVRNGNSDFWAYSTAGMHWIVDPLWYVPWNSASYFAPPLGRYVASDGRDRLGTKPPPEFQRLVDWYKELYSLTEADPRRLDFGHRILSQWAEECYTIGICRQDLLVIVSDRLRNVPEHIIHDYRVMTPGYIGIEQFYLDQTSTPQAARGGTP